MNTFLTISLLLNIYLIMDNATLRKKLNVTLTLVKSLTSSIKGKKYQITNEELGDIIDDVTKHCQE